ncbi:MULTISPECIES: LysR family transcriptional regulator [Halomonas]|uniref:LysR family transcriptional regulator n=1 Tax=Halomonas TaxID=2745 RepID=UPI001A8CA8C7|nr:MULTISPECIES: LysR family transcriptional regulator [Halomonas]MED5294991.1 LysR family transcriptional regulator [Pseudomonadota bacterium]MBN8413216.1 LysR family transcriptional regulator [Halomonas litopenaei]MBY5924211.1 LysR family transcriptional regulator [Halomonas sp. DP4Y7-2]MBY5928380.1 LysR family transcriptional regulator [Halomonas sp. DP8Y7-3]MBY5967087.1 LysR family transcriptional regulator [Halomonas denitrificans]
MRIELRHLSAFVAVADCLHFRHAAERLNVAQPALSRTIAQLEEAIGETLLLRNNRQVRLTEPGRVMLEESRQILRHLDEAVLKTQRAGRGELGRLAIGYTDFAITGELPALLDDFRRLHPDIHFDLHFGSTASQLQDLTDCHLDFGFVTGPVLTPGLCSRPIQRDRFIAAVSEHHPLAQRRSIRLEELAHEPFILGAHSMWHHFRQKLELICREAGFEPKVAQETFNSETIFAFVACDFGVTVHLECASNYLRKGVTMVPLEGVQHSLVTEVAWREGELTPVQTAFLQRLDKQLPPEH